jgi:hypothetical protein
MTDELPPPLSFRMRVIALLWARGWPEYGLDDGDCAVWRSIGGFVRIEGDEPYPCCVDYETADGETGSLTFGEAVSPERVVEAIDRLRWVFGVPTRVGEGNLAGCLPPLIPPEGVVKALAEAHALMGQEIDDLLRRAGVLDPDGPPSVPLRVTPDPKEDPAYVPTRWIGVGGHRWIGE